MLWHFIHSRRCVCVYKCIIIAFHISYMQFYRIFAAIKVLNRTYDSKLLLSRLFVRLISFFNHFHFDFPILFRFRRACMFVRVLTIASIKLYGCMLYTENEQKSFSSYNENSLNAMTISMLNIRECNVA